MNKKPTLYIIEKYKHNTHDLEETIVLPIHTTTKETLIPYLNRDCDIWYGRHNKRNGRAYKISPYRFGEE